VSVKWHIISVVQNKRVIKQEDIMEKEKFFIIYLEEFTGNGSTESNTWKIGSKLFDDYDDAMKIYKQVNQSHSCQICKTIYG